MARAATPNRIADLAVFFVGLRAFVAWTESPDHVESTKVARHLGAAANIAKRFGPQMTGGLQGMEALVAKKFSPFKDELKAALRGGSPAEVAIRQGDFWTALLPRLSSKTVIMRDLYGQRGAPVMRALGTAASNSSPLAVLSACATITPVSGLRVGHVWLEKAAMLAGVPVSELDSLTSDAGVATDLGKTLGEVKNAIETTDPLSPKAARLQDKRQEIERKVEQVAATSKNPEAVKMAAATAASTTYQHRTPIGKRLGHTPEQEQAMMAQGRTIIAAGAGSGKTRVLASKVAWHIENGVAASSILATSFTRKSSAELVRRVEDYGGVIEQNAMDGFGTTHSIAGKMMNRSARQFKRANGYMGKKEGWKQVTVLRLAVEQVKMKGSGKQPPAPVGFWEGDYIQESDPSVDPAFIESVEAAINYFGWIVSQRWYSSRGKWGKSPSYIAFMKDIRGRSPGSLSAAEKQLANTIFSKSKNYGQPVTYRVASAPRVAAEVDEDTVELQAEMARAEKKRSTKLKEYEFYGKSANQWFNLGRSLEREDTSGKAKDVPLGEFKRYISIVKGKGLSPSQAWHGEGDLQPGTDEAAVYAAYEWLKGSSGEPTFQSLGDMDDILIDAVRAMVASPDLRDKIQSRYKVLLIDEAQDLNKVQHIMFGLMAGYFDPETQEPKADKEMTADTFALIGDDKQAIYEFRGADPKEFIRKSDMTPGGDDFETNILKMNFRSGEAIVKGANRLIARNTAQGQQIPMVCDANVDVKGQGQLVSRPAASTADAALKVADEIEALVKEGLVSPHDKKSGSGGYSSFGVALRSNAEAYEYGLELLKKGIPFKSNARFFNDRNSKAMIGWLTLAEGGDAARMNAALLDAMSVPLTQVSPKTVGSKLENVPGVWADFLANPSNFSKIYYRNRRMQSRLAVFANNVQLARGFSGSPQEVLQQVMGLRGLDGASFKESLIDSVKENSDVMAELEAEANEGIVTAGAIEEMAMAPIQPLLALMGQKEDLTGAMNFVRKLQKVNEKISSRDDVDDIDRDAVTIGTMHSWKGLEVPNMFVPMVGGKFPRTKSEKASEAADLYSARRLAYVAITRAEDRCVILDIPHPSLKDENGRPLHSQFIDEACMPIEGLPADEDSASFGKQGASGRIWDEPTVNDLLQSLMDVPDEAPMPQDREASLEQLWGDTLGES
ncbi:ATP-dependent helicase [Deltaproteobacteria bacterium]|nr:ATP-dependent helicase [Deltaproteobacteria bacterium]